MLHDLLLIASLLMAITYLAHHTNLIPLGR